MKKSSSSSWGLGRAAVCDCGTPWTFLLPFFHIQVGQDGPDKLRVNWPFGSREEVQYRFSRWRPSWIFNLNDFSYF